MAFRRGNRRIEVETGEVIPGCGLDEEQGGGGNDQDEKGREKDAPKQVSPEAAVHDEVFGSSADSRYRAPFDASVSALQSSCGICGAGVGLTTRRLVASVTFGATK